MTIEEIARTLWGNLPIIQEDYIQVIQETLEKQKAEYDSQLPLIKETYYNAGYEAAKNKMIDKTKRAFCSVCGCKECTERNVTCEDYKEFVKYIEK